MPMGISAVRGRCEGSKRFRWGILNRFASKAARNPDFAELV